MLSEVTEVEGEKQKIRTNSSVSVRLEKKFRIHRKLENQKRKRDRHITPHEYYALGKTKWSA